MATHHDVPTHVTAVKPWAAEMVVGADHDEPLNVNTWFRPGTATQNVGLGQVRYCEPWGDGALPTGPIVRVRPSRNWYVVPACDPAVQLPTAGHETTVKAAPGASATARDHPPVPGAAADDELVVVDDEAPGDPCEQAVRVRARAPRARPRREGRRTAQPSPGTVPSPSKVRCRDHVSRTIRVLVPVTRPRRRNLSIT